MTDRGVGYALGFMTALAVVAAALLVFRSSGGQLVRIDTTRPAVVSQVQRLQRLETVTFGIDRIVTGERESKYLPRFLAGDRLLLIVFGQVVAGVDLARIREADVEVAGRAVTLQVPPAEIFTTRLDSTRTRVYSRETGLFSSVDPDLESEVRAEAERQIRQAAIDGGILDTATANARTTLTLFLRGLGFNQVD